MEAVTRTSPYKEGEEKGEIILLQHVYKTDLHMLITGFH